MPDNFGELANQGHFGLLGLNERSELAGACLKIRSTPGSGTVIMVQLDLAKDS